MKRTLALLLVLVMAFSLCLTGCGTPAEETASDTAEAPAAETDTAEAAEPAAAPADGEPVYGGSATIYYQNFNQVFDPAMSESYTYSLWLEALWGPNWGLNDPDTYNFDANVLPLAYMDGQIAKEWNWVKNGDGTSELEVTIRDDIYFQDKDAEYDVFGGRNLTAEDVAYSYTRLLEVEEASAAAAEPQPGEPGYDPNSDTADEPQPGEPGYDPNADTADAPQPGEPGYDPNSDGGASAEAGATVSYDVDWNSVFSGILDLTRADCVEATGDYTLVFHLCTESEVKLETLMYTQVKITGVEWDTLTDEQRDDWHYACGTGPFILVGYEPDSYYKFERNPKYYDYDERHPENQLPYLDELILTSVNDAAAIQSSFIAGNLDYVSMDANLTADQTNQIVDALDGDVQVLYYASNAAGIALKVNQEPFSDIRVRIALQKAVNLEEVNAAYYDYETPLELAGLWIADRSEWSAIDEWDDELTAEYSYDPEGAKALLAEAGYPDGFTFTCALDTNADQDLYQLIKSYFAAIGVTMEIEVCADMMEAHNISGDGEDPRVINQNIADLESAESATFMYASTGFANPTFHTDTEFDSVLEAAGSATDTQELIELSKQADLMFSESHWIIACSGCTQKTELLSSRIGGLENGERISYRCFTQNFLARIWVKDGQ